MTIARSLAGIVLALCLLAITAPVAFATLNESVNVTAPANNTLTGGNLSINITLPIDLVNLTVSVTGPGGSFLLNQSDNVAESLNVTWPATNGSFSDGSYNITVLALNATDTADNLTSLLTNITLDTSNPAVTNLSTNAVRNSTKTNASIRVDASVTDLTGFTVNLSNGTTRPMSIVSGNLYRYTGNATDLGCPANGTCMITINATDALGHQNITMTINITVDDVVPNVTSIGASSISSDDGTVSATADEEVLFTFEFGSSADDLDTMNVTTTYATTYTLDIVDLDAGTAYYYNLTACDAAGNCFTNGTNTFTTSTLSSGGSGGGGGGGGGGGYNPPTTDVEISQGRVWSVIQPGSFTYAPSGLAISTVLLTFTNASNSVHLTITQYKTRPANIQPLTDATVYKYLEIAHQGLVGSVGTYRLTIQVPTAWMNGNGLTQDTVALYRLESGVWKSYTTIHGTIVNGSQSFTATVPGFSAFAIGGVPAPTPEPVEETVPETPTPETTEPTTPEPESPSFVNTPTIITKDNNIGMLTMLIVIVAVLAVGGFVGVKGYRASKERGRQHEQELVHQREEVVRTREQTIDIAQSRTTATLAAAQAFADLHAVKPVVTTESRPIFDHPQYHEHVAPLREYIRKSRDTGLSDEQIAQRLSNVGWGAHVIEHELGASAKKA